MHRPRLFQDNHRLEICQHMEKKYYGQGNLSALIIKLTWANSLHKIQKENNVKVTRLDTYTSFHYISLPTNRRSVYRLLKQTQAVPYQHRTSSPDLSSSRFPLLAKHLKILPSKSSNARGSTMIGINPKR